jgi:outer membrane receptor protein involved in Fe transport
MRRSIVHGFTLFCILFSLAAFGQPPAGGGRPGMTGMQAIPRVTIAGKVLDASTGKPLEYATVVLFAKRDGRQITGCVTAPDGTFEMKDLFPGQFRMTVNYMGYKPQSLEDVSPKRGSASLDVGTVRLEPTVIPGRGVDVQADRPEFEYKIDRRVINVGQQQTALSGTAVDALENVPTITVDSDNNVQLRGSSNFTVLIDNRPTPLDANTALQQTPASTIDQIEIITNPSAKYDPDGTAGIINLILKKEKRGGVSGIANANIGLNDVANRTGGDVLLNWRTGKATVYAGVDYNKRAFPGTFRSEQRTYLNDTTLYRDSHGDNDRGGHGYGVRAGIDYSITPKDLVSLGFRAGGHSFGGGSEIRYDEWSLPGGIHAFSRSTDRENHAEDFYSGTFDFKHDFARPGHELQGEVIVNGETGDEESVNRLIDAADSLIQAQRSGESGPSTDVRVKLDYTMPLRTNEKVQAGYQNRINTGDDRNSRYLWDAASGSFVFQQPYSHQIEYSHLIQSLYATYSNEFGRIGVQAGARGEYTGRDIRLKDTGEKFSIDRWDVFPTLHSSYTIAEGRQVMASYTRRVQRPRDWELEPFETWMDAYNVRRGNPDLKPEFIDSYEATFQSMAGQSLFSVDAYYRVTNNKMERVQSLYAPRITLNSMANVGRDYSFGSEIMLNVSPVKPWNVNLMGSLYQYKVEGDLLGRSFSRHSFNWNLRFNNTFRLTATTRLQANGMYNSASVSSQGKRKGNIMTNFSVRQEFWNRALAATFQVRDAFKSGIFDFTTEGEGFTTHNRMKREAPVYSLTMTLNLNNYKRENHQPNENGNGNGESQEGSEEPVGVGY